jgi:hypothetical protein
MNVFLLWSGLNLLHIVFGGVAVGHSTVQYCQRKHCLHLVFCWLLQNYSSVHSQPHNHYNTFIASYWHLCRFVHEKRQILDFTASHTQLPFFINLYINSHYLDNQEHTQLYYLCNITVSFRRLIFRWMQSWHLLAVGCNFTVTTTFTATATAHTNNAYLH